jgi:hypothetical protein
MTENRTSSLIRTPFGFESTATEVIAGIDLSSRRAIVTGASSGIGIETARALAAAGADVTLAVRDTVAGARTAARLRPPPATAFASAGSISPTKARWPPSLLGGPGRCMCWSTTPA